MILKYLIMFLMAYLLFGCAPINVMIGVREPDLTKITPTATRIDVEKILGKRLWHAGVAEGYSYDIYQFKSERPANPVLGLFVLLYDAMSFGIIELMYDPQNMLPVKQVAVTYDVQDRVIYISRPWSVEKLGPCRRQRSLFPTDSGVPDAARPEPLNDVATSSSNKVKLEHGNWGVMRFSVDGEKFKDVAYLSPGAHEIIYYPRINYYYDTLAIVTLLPGRTYYIKSESFMGYMRSNPFYYIEDADSREVLHCIPPS